MRNHKLAYFNDNFAPIQAFCTKWPYVTFSGLNKNFLMVLNAYEKDKIYRIELPDPDNISHTYITENNDLFIMS